MRSASSTVEDRIAAYRSTLDTAIGARSLTTESRVNATETSFGVEVVPLEDVSTDRSPSGNRRWMATTAASLILVGGVTTMVLTRHDADTVPPATQPTLPAPSTTVLHIEASYSWTDLDLTMPVVGRGWADTMDFSFSPDFNARIYNAWQTSIAQCMHSAGFADYTAVQFPPNASYIDLVSPLDQNFAAVMGYHGLPAEPINPNPSTTDYGEALNSATGCGATADLPTAGSVDDYIAANDQLRSSIGSAIDGFADSETGSTVENEWSQCMSEHNLSFQSRLDAILRYADNPTVTSQEIETRLIDLDCDLAVGYTQTQHDWEKERVDAWLISEQQAIEDAVAKRAQAEQQLIAIEAAVVDAGRS